jgi:hypothetical protein
MYKVMNSSPQIPEPRSPLGEVFPRASDDLLERAHALGEEIKDRVRRLVTPPETSDAPRDIPPQDPVENGEK